METQYVKCLITIENSSGIYCLEGKEYEIREKLESINKMIIKAKNNVDIIVNIDDNCFEILE